MQFAKATPVDNLDDYVHSSLKLSSHKSLLSILPIHSFLDISIQRYWPIKVSHTWWNWFWHWWLLPSLPFRLSNYGIICLLKSQVLQESERSSIRHYKSSLEVLVHHFYFTSNNILNPRSFMLRRSLSLVPSLVKWEAPCCSGQCFCILHLHKLWMHNCFLLLLNNLWVNMNHSLWHQIWNVPLPATSIICPGRNLIMICSTHNILK